MCNVGVRQRAVLRALVVLEQIHVLAVVDAADLRRDHRLRVELRRALLRHGRDRELPHLPNSAPWLLLIARKLHGREREHEVLAEHGQRLVEARQVRVGRGLLALRRLHRAPPVLGRVSEPTRRVVRRDVLPDEGPDDGGEVRGLHELDEDGASADAASIGQDVEVDFVEAAQSARLAVVARAVRADLLGLQDVVASLLDGALGERVEFEEAVLVGAAGAKRQRPLVIRVRRDLGARRTVEAAHLAQVSIAAVVPAEVGSAHRALVAVGVLGERARVGPAGGGAAVLAEHDVRVDERVHHRRVPQVQRQHVLRLLHRLELVGDEVGELEDVAQLPADVSTQVDHQRVGAGRADFAKDIVQRQLLALERPQRQHRRPGHRPHVQHDHACCSALGRSQRV
mmetsp:Transcript_94107/g.140997  ORF Transcript_94107/g.140997 Transcript_94107/m.140997 type:complete len:398 (-) Transcript_94107:1101-2294(-)